jgi:hypothetical protein
LALSEEAYSRVYTIRYYSSKEDLIERCPNLLYAWHLFKYKMIVLERPFDIVLPKLPKMPKIECLEYRFWGFKKNKVI